MSLKRISHDDNNHFGSAKRDAANGVAGLDASKEIINDVPVANLVDVDEQSFTNLLKNGDFESWSAGVAAAPDGWTLFGAGMSVARSTTKKIGTYSVAMTRAGTTGYLLSVCDEYLAYAGRTVTAGVWVKTAIASQIRIQLYDGVDSSVSGIHTGGGNWELMEVSHTLDNTPLQLEMRIITYIDGVAYIDGVIFVEGSVCPAFSPKPLVDDGKSIGIDSDTNKVTFGGLIIYSQTPQILTGAGAVDLTSIITHLVTGGAGADAVTLADGIEGQHKTIIMKTITTGGDTSVVTPTHFANGSTITGNSVGDIQNMMFSNGAWHWTGGRGAIIA